MLTINKFAGAVVSDDDTLQAHTLALPVACAPTATTIWLHQRHSTLF